MLWLFLSSNPNENPSSSSVDISHTFIHNHIATPNGDHSKLSVITTGDNSQKQKRQSNFKRAKRNHEVPPEEVDKSESDEVDETDEEDETIDSAEDTKHRDRLDELTNLRIPFWDTYDSINQLYLEMGEFNYEYCLLTNIHFCCFYIKKA